jgi:hypothetical protein
MQSLTILVGCAYVWIIPCLRFAFPFTVVHP